MLFDPLMAGRQQAQQNQLMQQQQELTDHDVAMTGQAAAPLLNMSEQDAEAAYPGWLQDMQRQGLAKYAPPTYPGHAATQALVQRAIPLVQQYNLGIMVPPGLATALQGNQPPAQGGPPSAQGGQGNQPPVTSAAPSGTIEPAALTNANAVRDGLIKRGMDPDAATAFAANALHESVANPNTGPGDGGASHGLFQWNGDRAAGFQAIYGHSPDNAPLDEQLDYVMHELNGPELLAKGRIAQAQGVDGKAAEVSQAYLRPKDVVPEMQRRSATALQLQRQNAQPGQGGQATTTTAAAPAAAGPVTVGDSLASPGGLGGSGVVGASPSAVRAQIAQGVQNGAYTGKDVVLSSGASNAPGDMENVEAQLKQLRDASSVTLLGVGPAIEAKNPGTNANLAKLAAQYGAKFQPLPGDQMSPDGVHPNAAGYATLKTATAPPGAAPQGGRYQVASNAPVGPPSTTAAAPGAATGTPPAAPVVAQGGQPPATAQPPAQPSGPQANLPHASEVPTGQNSPQYREAQRIQQQISQLMPYAALPAAKAKIAQLQSQQQLLMQTDNVVQTQEGQLHTLTGAIDKTAAPLADYHETTPGSGIWVGGPGTEPKFQPPGRLVIDKAGNVWQTSVGGAHMLSPTDPQAITALNAAQAQGSATGTDVGKQLPAMIAQARAAAQQEGQIDYATNQLREAAKGGIPSGYFSDALATAAAAAKSLGIDTSSLGVNPQAVGNMQTAQKTLAVIGGAILQQAIGKDSQITNDKIEAFIHTQPGIQNDPQALQRIMAWARSQYTYEREMGQAAVAQAAQSSDRHIAAELAGPVPPYPRFRAGL